MKDDTELFERLLKSMALYEEEQIFHTEDWIFQKQQYYKIYSKWLNKIHSLEEGIGFHLWSIMPKQYAADHVTPCITPDVDAFLTFSIHLHLMNIHTSWASGETHWIVFIFKPKN